MYYLLEDNRIVDRLSIREDLDLPFEIDFYVGKDEIVLTIDNIYFEHISIIKKAENAWGLIDWNTDLARINIDDESLIVSGKGAESDLRDGFFDVEWINAIYKPNSKGDYIKAWEKKDDN